VGECYYFTVPPIDPALLESYDYYPRIEEAFQAALDESLNPRGPDSLFNLVGSLGLRPEAEVLDLGCGEGRFSIELAKRFGFRVTGVDPVPRHIEICTARRDEAAGSDPPLRDLLGFKLGAAEAIPLPNASIDLIWCREVLVLVEGLDAAFAECRRVLRTSGRMFIHDTFKTHRLESGVAESFSDPQRIKAVFGTAGLGADAQRTEAAFTAAGFVVEDRIEFGSEWGEFSQERTGAAGRRLIHAARLLRDPDRYTAQFGQAAYDIMLADCFWHICRMIGKLTGRVYVISTDN
jgi:SAM-dependent methyltransferase